MELEFNDTNNMDSAQKVDNPMILSTQMPFIVFNDTVA